MNQESVKKYRKFLESQLIGAQAQLDDHPRWRRSGHVDETHYQKWSGAKYAFEEALRSFDAYFEVDGDE